MSPPAASLTRFGARATLGRLSGLALGEANRGERSLWLTGDGHRAALFHLGALSRLNQLGLLAGVQWIGAASGGSIAAAMFATRVDWPLRGRCPDWETRIAAPLRALAAAGERSRASFGQRPFPGLDGEAAMEERYARELLDSEEDAGLGPSFVVGASGMALSGIEVSEGGCLEWEIGTAAPGGYGPELVAGEIAEMQTGLARFEEVEQAVLENHGYLLADAAARRTAISIVAKGRVPHPEWIDAERVQEALADARQAPRIRRLRLRRRGQAEGDRTPPRAG